MGCSPYDSGLGSVGGFDQAEDFGVEGHAQGQAHLDEFLLDLVEGFLAEVAVLEHFVFALLREFADGGDVGVVQAVGGADAQLDLVDGDGEFLGEFFAGRVDGLFGVLEFDDVLVEVDEDVEVVAQDGGGEGEGFVGADAAVGPDFEGEFVVVGAAPDAGVDDVVFDAPDGREEGVDGYQADFLLGLHVPSGGAVARPVLTSLLG